MRYFVCALAIVAAMFSCAGVSAELIGVFGPVTIEASRTPTAGLPDYSTWRLTAKSGLEIRAFDFVGNPRVEPAHPEAFGFLGPMNQVNPFGLPTVFPDWNILGPFEFPRHLDSHFNVSPTQGLVIGASESSNHLRAAFAKTGGPYGHSLEFIQLVVRDDISGVVKFRGTVVVGPLGALQEVPIAGRIPLIPEPTSFRLAILAMLGLAGVIRHR